MSISGITVDASMLAALIWIHRIHSRNIRTFYFINNGFWIGIDDLGFMIQFPIFIQSLDMFLHIIIFREFIVRIYLRTPAFYIFLLHFYLMIFGCYEISAYLCRVIKRNNATKLVKSKL